MLKVDERPQRIADAPMQLPTPRRESEIICADCLVTAASVLDIVVCREEPLGRVVRCHLARASVAGCLRCDHTLQPLQSSCGRYDEFVDVFDDEIGNVTRRIVRIRLSIMCEYDARSVEISPYVLVAYNQLF